MKILTALFLTTMFCHLTVAGQEIIEKNGTSGTINITGSNYVNELNKRYLINTNTTDRVKLTIQIDIEEDCDYVFVYETNNDFTSLQYVQGYTGIGEYEYVSYSNNGKLVVDVVSDSYVCNSEGFDGYEISYGVSNKPTNNFPQNGPSYMESHTTVPNFTINEPVFKTMGAIGSRATDYANSILLLKNSGTQLGLGANKIAASSSLGLSSSGNVFYSAVGHYFNTMNVNNAFVINNAGKVLMNNAVNTKAYINIKPSGATWETFFNVRDGEYAFELGNVAGTMGSNYGFGIKATTKDAMSAFYIAGDHLGTSTGGRGIIVFDARKNGTTIGATDVAFEYVSGYGNRIAHINGDGSFYTAKDIEAKGMVRASEVKVSQLASAAVEVTGTLSANSIKVSANGQTADFVFDEGYELKTLAEVEQYIKEHKHLPNIPSAAQMEANGVDLAEMNKLLLQKVEELTLYILELENDNLENRERINKIESIIAGLINDKGR